MQLAMALGDNPMQALRGNKQITKMLKDLMF